MHRTILAVLLLSDLLHAVCGQPQPRLVCAEYFRSDVVAVARLARIRHLVPKNADDGFVYTMQLQSSIRGQIGRRFNIYEENSSGRASFDWKRGESYLLFLWFEPTDHAWELDGCGNSGPEDKAGAVVDAIHKIESARDSGAKTGLLEGDVRDSGV